ncbi:MAG: molybdopterin-guanine dinucleotide biosynthesis protein MobB [Desulfobacterales bacterium]|nr:molybdopterin-guanine dinucleotide biosynthesis protein MobB [Desulfobacterales bacterium]
MRVLAVVGYSGSGKTRLVVRLVGELRRRGLRVAAVKRCSHGFALDTEGKDTAAFAAAGAEGVAMVSPEGWAAVADAPGPDARGPGPPPLPGRRRRSSSRAARTSRGCPRSRSSGPASRRSP